MKNHMGFLPLTGEITATGLELPENLTPEQWAEAGMEIARTGSASKWWLGDWWKFAEHKYGDRKAIVDSENWDGPAFQTCKDAGWVASEFERSLRKDLLSFNHHKAVISLPHDWRMKLLDEAEVDGLSVRALVQRVKEVKQHVAQGWTPDQEARQAIVKDGGTVLANMHGDDAALISWADAQGLLERIDRQSDWGNPFEMGKDGNRETVIASFKVYYDLKPSLQKRIGELRGKVLACWCCPESCHGEVLIEAAALAKVNVIGGR